MLLRHCSYLFSSSFEVSPDDVDNDLINMTMKEDEAVLEEVKNSFPCWQAKKWKKKIMMNTNWKSVTCKSVSRILCLLVVLVLVGISIQEAKDISIWWQTKTEFIYNHAHNVPCNHTK